jgi:hypothetical protein
MPAARAKLCAKYGVNTDPQVTIVRCLRCNHRWNPTRVLYRRGYRLPSRWWLCPNDCNSAAAMRYESTHTAPTDQPDAATTAADRPVDNPVMSPEPTHAVPETDLEIPRRACSGETLTFDDLRALMDAVAEGGERDYVA